MHHLLEARFNNALGQGYSSAKCIVVTAKEHQMFTNAWRHAIPYGSNYTAMGKEAILENARLIYAHYPAILLALGL